MAKQKNRISKQSNTNSVRIIGGQWRGRNIEFTTSDGLRPTSDRVRETLFSWLQIYTPDSVCLDLFAGSGALGFEALSRGAVSVTMVELSKSVVNALQQNADKFQTDGSLQIIQARASNFLTENNQQFDIIFVDPPFHSNLLAETIEFLSTASWVSAGTVIYVETARNLDINELIASHWSIKKQKNTTQVSCYLIVVN